MDRNAHQCHGHVVTSIALHKVFAALRQDHPAVYEVFESYQDDSLAESEY